MLFRITSLLVSGHAVGRRIRRVEEKIMVFIFVNWLVGCLLDEERKERCDGTETSTLLWQRCIHLKS